MNYRKLRELLIICGLAFALSGCANESPFQSLLEQAAAGNTAARDDLTRQAKENPLMAYDGSFRLCMILDKHLVSGYHESNIVNIIPLKNTPIPIYGLDGPEKGGVIVKEANFSDDYLIIYYWPAASKTSPVPRVNKLMKWRLRWPKNTAISLSQINNESNWTIEVVTEKKENETAPEEN